MEACGAMFSVCLCHPEVCLSSDSNDVVQCLSQWLVGIGVWIRVSWLKLNPNKTEVMLGDWRMQTEENVEVKSAPLIECLPRAHNCWQI